MNINNYQEFLNINFLNNSMQNYLIALAIFTGLFFAFKLGVYILNKYLIKFSAKSENDFDDIIIKILKEIKNYVLIYLSFYFAIKFLEIGNFAEKLFDALFWIFILLQAIKSGQILINYLTHKFLAKDDEDHESEMAISAINLIAKILLWSFALLTLLSNLGVNITSLVAGLGIGGLAVAFALQNILGDLFASFTIYFDKPFKVGDFIVVKDRSGVVEKIGIKTTRIKALQGEEIVMSNADLTDAVVQNFKKLEERRHAFEIGVIYKTSQEKIEMIPDIIKNIINEIDGLRFDRSHFKTFGDSALIYETVYFAETADYNEFMNMHQKMNFEIKRIFDEQEIEMAFPTQTVYLEK